MKCRKCKIKFDSSKVVYQGIYYFCSKSCRLSFTREQQNKIKDKIKERKHKKIEKKRNSISQLTKKADKLWSEIIRLHWVCEYDLCNKSEYLNAHHIIWRSNKNLRWSLFNGICLCAWHHTFNSDFSAHKQPLLFSKRFEGYKGSPLVEKLTREANIVFKVTPEYLHEVINEFEWILKNNKKSDD